MSILSDLLINELIEQGIPHEIITHDEITCVDDGVALLGFPEDKILKTIGFSVDNQYVFVVLQGRERIDYKKLVRFLGVKRNALKMLTSDIVENELGYQTGGLSPLHRNEKINVIIDATIARLDIVFCGIGVRNKTLKISSKHLISASEATLLDLSNTNNA